MSIYKDRFMSYMNEKGIKYADMDADAVRVIYTGDNVKTITIFVIFDKDGRNLAALRSWDIASFKSEKWVDGLTLCNTLNRKYRWVKFCMNDEGGLSAEDDAVLDEATAGPECLELVNRMVGIVDESYPTIMKTLWA